MLLTSSTSWAWGNNPNAVVGLKPTPASYQRQFHLPCCRRNSERELLMPIMGKPEVIVLTKRPRIPDFAFSLADFPVLIAAARLDYFRFADKPPGTSFVTSLKPEGRQSVGRKFMYHYINPATP